MKLTCEYNLMIGVGEYVTESHETLLVSQRANRPVTNNMHTYFARTRKD